MPEWPMTLDSVVIPDKFAFRKEVSSGLIEQLITPARKVSGTYSVEGRGTDLRGVLRATSGEQFHVFSAPPVGLDDELLIAPKAQILKPSRLFSEDGSLKWWPAPQDVPGETASQIRTFNRSLFRFAKDNTSLGERGLRSPQIGAIHAVLGHWSVSTEPTTVVMPTGTGKTETMLALLAHGEVERLLVIVPSNPLREQTYRKFLTNGLLPSLGVLGEGSRFPIVGRLDHELTTAQDADDLFALCNVVVATVQALSGSHPNAITRVAELCSHLFLDEAHHVAAPSWREIKNRFANKCVVQFTATPYRRDKKRVDGRIVFNYPLRKAQEEGYFAPIKYRPVYMFSKETADRAIAETAIDQLREDLEAGHDHILMARVETIDRAENEVIDIYRELAPDLNPVFIHSQMGRVKQRAALAAMLSRTSKVVVCVDMLGEGFDLRQLKIAAIHDVHKSLAITLQFTGRFTRPEDQNLGIATMVANAGDASMEHGLRELYSEDADWNHIIRRLGEGAVGDRVAQSEFLATFPNRDTGVPLENILPKMSTVVYKTTCDDWTPELLASAINPDVVYVKPTWSDEHKVAYFVTREFEEIPWGDLRELQNLTWHLYLLYWDSESKALYINSSNNDELHQDLADAASDGTAERVHGEAIYRALFDIKRLILMNLGLLHATGRAIRHTMHNGSDVGEQLKPSQLGNKAKTNLFGRGYENGERVSLGCSLKGRIWSHQAAESIPEWVDWCKSIGAKLLDDAITEEQVLKGVLRPELVTTRPALVPLLVDWNTRTYMRSEFTLRIRIGDVEVPFYETELRILDFVNHGDVRFALLSDTTAVEYRAKFSATGVEFSATKGEAFLLSSRGNSTPLSTLFKKEPPAIFFEQDTFVEDNLIYVVNVDTVGPFSREAIEVWDWTGVDLAKESQGHEKRADSIQRHVLNQLCADQAWELVFDDDSSGEAADILAVRREGAFVHIDLYHCKFAKGGTVSNQVENLYEVCGQAQKSIRWRERAEGLFKHLKHREAKRVKDGRPSRIEKGDAKTLFELLNNAHLLKPVYRVFIVQPGMSKAEATLDQLRLLGATETYLSDTCSVPLRVIASP